MSRKFIMDYTEVSESNPHYIREFTPLLLCIETFDRYIHVPFKNVFHTVVVTMYIPYTKVKEKIIIADLFRSTVYLQMFQHVYAHEQYINGQFKLFIFHIFIYILYHTDNLILNSS